MNSIEEIVQEVGVIVVQSDKKIDYSAISLGNINLIQIEVSKCISSNHFIATIQETLRCPDNIFGLDDLYDKIIDLYWIRSNSKPVIVFSGFGEFFRSCDEFDQDRMTRIFTSLDHFWKFERVPLYSRHSECLYILLADDFTLL